MPARRSAEKVLTFCSYRLFVYRQLGVLGLTSGGNMSTTRHHLPNMTLPRVPYSDTLFFAVLHDLIPNHLYVASYAALP